MWTPFIPQKAEEVRESENPRKLCFISPGLESKNSGKVTNLLSELFYDA